MKGPKSLPKLFSKVLLTVVFAAAGILGPAVFMTPALAFSVPARPDGYVYDEAGLLSAPVKASLKSQLHRFEAETSNQLVVAVFKSLDGEVLEDVTLRLAEAWKAGQKAKDNGVLLVIFKEDRAVRIEVGYGLEGALPDALAKTIIENEIIPGFRAGSFDLGVQAGVDAIIAATRHEYQPEPVKDTAADLFGPQVLVLSFILAAVVPLKPLAVFFVLGIFGLLYGFISGVMPAAFFAFFFGILPLPIAGIWYQNRSGTWIGSGGYGRGYSRRWGGGGFGGGGFSGGGGGFGGGGASGRW